MSAPSASAAPRWRRAVGLACIAGGTLLAEVALTRVLSVSLYHHFAFLVVSTALLGTSVAGAYSSASGWLAKQSAQALGGGGALLLALGLPVCFAVTQSLALEPLALATSFAELVKLAVVYVLLGVPFFGSGLAIAVTLERYVADAHRLYAADLFGAGVGSFATLLALSAVGGVGAIVTGAAIAALGAACLGGPRLRVAGLCTAVALAALTPFADAVLPLHITQSKVTRSGEPFSKLLADTSRTKSTAWNSLARVDHVVFRPGLERLMIDAGVAAVRIPTGSSPVESDATLPYELHPGGRVMIVGAGAGWEVEEALAFGAGHVDAVEVNALIAAHAPARLREDARVTWIVDEARSVLERAEEAYDAIVMIHTISNAATSAGAMHLAEDFLLTQEALALLVDRLSADGTLFLTRPEAQLYRLLASLPEDVHVYAWSERAAGPSFYGALLIFKQRPSEAAHATIVARIASRPGLRMLFTPPGLTNAKAPTDPAFEAILAGQDLARFEDVVGSRLDPATDDRPFFHQRRRFSELSWADFERTLGIRSGARMALEDRPFAEIAAVLLLVETTLVGALALLLPLFFGRRRLTVSRRRTVAVFAYFAALGLGFMLVEIALVQRLGLLLGAPALTLATVFFGLLVGAGAGSALSKRLPRPEHAPAFAVGAAVALALLLPFVLGAGSSGAEPVRVALALAVVLPTGAALGLAFPAGLSRLEDAPALVPWAFATNGLLSVAGTVLAIIGASSVGFTGVLLAGAAVYAIAWLAATRLGC
ncbi:MAG: class I SAM-dependent methyltransferase [Deltaproteobacteria bacterium]